MSSGPQIMRESSPAINLTVVVPILNEVKYLNQTLHSIKKAKNYYDRKKGHVRVIISNNGSVDGSRELIENFALENPNIEYLHHDVTMSGDEHFSKIINLCESEFTCIVGGHDLVSKSYFYDLETTLKSNPHSPLCFSKEYVDITGLGKEVFKVDFQYLFSGDSFTRFWQSIFYLGSATCIQGVIRTQLLKSIDVSSAKVSDLVWLHGLLKHGPFVYAPSASYVRTHPIRDSNFVSKKSDKLKSKKEEMSISLLRVWDEPSAHRRRKVLARLIIKLKFNQSKIGQFTFRLLRRLSRISIPAASKSRRIGDICFTMSDVI